MTRRDSSAPIVYGVTIPLSAQVFLGGQLNLLAKEHPDVHLIYGPDSPGPVDGIDSRVTQHVVPVRRDPSPWQDLRGLFQVLRLLREIQPLTVVMGTPKMGLLGLLAARMMGVNRRVYILYGLRLEGARGLARLFLWCMEWLSMACATEILALSVSNRVEAVRMRLTRSSKISVIGSGSIGGVDLSRFHLPSADARVRARTRFGLPADAPVVGFLGRLTPDKGLADMAAVWRLVHSAHPDAWLLVVGPDESSAVGRGGLVEALTSLPNVRVCGPVSDPESAFAAMDLLLLLTRREGFGMVLVEAAGCGVPAVVTRVNGTVDAVVDGVTATLVGLGDVAGAADAVSSYLDSPGLLQDHSQAGLARVRTEFASDRVDRRWVDHLVGAGGAIHE